MGKIGERRLHDLRLRRDTVIEDIAPSGTTYRLAGVGYVTRSSQSYYQENASAARSPSAPVEEG